MAISGFISDSLLDCVIACF